MGSVGVINGSPRGWNTPTTSIDSFYTTSDARKNVSMGRYVINPSFPNVVILYVKKYLTQVVITDDGESDWPILRYADILLMLAEAQGNTAASVGLISQIRVRAGLSSITGAFGTVAAFEKELTDQRRLEFAFENHRWFDLVRYATTLTTINAIDVMKANFAYEYAVHYSQYTVPVPTLAFLQASITVNKLLLPIPQREIDTNTQLVITQNPGY